jgi:hypothetical protein
MPTPAEIIERKFQKHFTVTNDCRECPSEAYPNPHHDPVVDAINKHTPEWERNKLASNLAERAIKFFGDQPGFCDVLDGMSRWEIKDLQDEFIKAFEADLLEEGYGN